RQRPLARGAVRWTRTLGAEARTSQQEPRFGRARLAVSLSGPVVAGSGCLTSGWWPSYRERHPLTWEAWASYAASAMIDRAVGLPGVGAPPARIPMGHPLRRALEEAVSGAAQKPADTEAISTL